MAPISFSAAKTSPCDVSVLNRQAEAEEREREREANAISKALN